MRNPYNKNENKAVLFFSASSVGDTRQLLDFGIDEILVSYFYMRKSIGFYNTTVREMHARGGLFMTDSGAFSFMGKNTSDEEWEAMQKEEYWLPYLKEYTDWLWENKDVIFVAANLDLDKIVGRDIVRKWNREYFEPLEKAGLQIVYVAHENDTDDRTGLRHFEEYCKRYRYVGVNQKLKKSASQIYTIAKKYRRRVHGFAWTEFSLCKQYPFFSWDSTTWLGGVRYGTTYDYDGKNFRTIDYTKKGVRRTRSVRNKETHGIDLSLVYGGKEDRHEINRMNLIGWLGFRIEVLKYANLKLWNEKVGKYCRASRSSR